jgi:cytochrome oxidase assembly protein ShyY1
VARPRGVVGLGIIALVMVAVLVSLGVWQLQRRVEKHAVIAALDQRLAAPPEALPQRAEWATLTRGRDEFRRVTFAATFEARPAAHVYTSGSGLRPDVVGTGAWVFAAADLAGGGTVAVNRGFAPETAAGAGVAGSADALPGDTTATPVQLTGYIRFPEAPGWLTPAADPARRLWFVRDPADMARALAWGSPAGEVAPFYIDLEAPVPPGGVPKPGPLAVHLKDNHLEYAITWFGLAAVVIATFGFWLAGAWRGRNGRGGPT